MVFSSLTFIAFFLPITIILYFIREGETWRNGVLLAVSLIFYAWGEPKFVLIMILSIIVNYITGILMAHQRLRKYRTIFMIIGVGLSLAFLFYYKYFSFLAGIFGADVPAKTLPIGISFYTFQIITYTVDVWREKVPAQRSIVKLGLYISFFPQLIAGPIVNYTYISSYLGTREIRPREFFNGMCRFFTGFGKKILIANMCGELLSYLDLTENVSFLGAWLGAIAYTFQIYFDFSGYSDMAIGMGKMFGFRFLENFNYPYTSRSVTDFWRRWHISLSTFFRDYVYIPLGGNRVAPGRHIVNLMIVWLLTGFWHGAAWNFIVWGVYYGALLILEKYILSFYIEKWPKILQWFYTIMIVMIGWVIFYHESLAAGIRHFGALFGIGTVGFSDPAAVYCLKSYLILLLIAAAACARWNRISELLVLFMNTFVERQSGKKQVVFLKDGTMVQTKAEIIARFVYCTIIFFLGIVFLAGSSFNPFLYFRF